MHQSRGLQQAEIGEEGRSSDESRAEKAKGALCALMPQRTEVLQQIQEE